MPVDVNSFVEHMPQTASPLGKSAWFAGDEITGADFLMIFPVEAAASRFGLGAYPKLQAYLERVHSRGAYQRALERGGPYQLLG